MIPALIGAAMYPAMTGNKGKFAPLRGMLIGGIASIVIGAFMPTSTTRISPLSPVRVSKTTDAVSMLIMDDNHHLRTVKSDMGDLTITVNDQPGSELKVYECHKVFAQNWMNFVGFRLPSTTYEVEVPSAMADSFISPTAADKTDVVFEHKLSSPVAVATNAK